MLDEKAYASTPTLTVSLMLDTSFQLTNTLRNSDHVQLNFILTPFGALRGKAAQHAKLRK